MSERNIDEEVESYKKDKLLKIGEIIDSINESFQYLMKPCGIEKHCKDCEKLDICIDDMADQIADLFWMVKQVALHIEYLEGRTIKPEDIAEAKKRSESKDEFIGYFS